MKKIILLVAVICSALMSFSQVTISIVDPANPGVDLNNTVVDKSGSASDFEKVKYCL